MTGDLEVRVAAQLRDWWDAFHPLVEQWAGQPLSMLEAIRVARGALGILEGENT